VERRNGLSVDSALFADVADVKERFPLAGATTNPSILLAAFEAGQQLGDVAIVRALAALQLPVVMAQPIGETGERQYAAAMRFIAIAPEQVVPRLVLTPAGQAAGRQVKRSGARVACTCVSTVELA
jgi:transaldolase